MKIDQVESELALFADIATQLHTERTSDGHTIALTRGGEQILLTFSDPLGASQVILRKVERTVKFSSYRSLLASPDFGNVQLLARSQSDLLRERFASGHFLEVQGEILVNHETHQISIDAVDDAVASPRPSGLRVVLIDGPAGIGKTHLIERLVYRRASTFRAGSRSPIVHVQSRGRVMTWLPDRIASTLQDFRVLNVTYEQLPVLVRHGLVQVAIDGFDELADPTGYENSWASLRAFVQSCIGQGALILAGRDTFLGVERLRKALIDLPEDSLAVVRLRAIEPNAARTWLSGHDTWSENLLKLAEDWGLFDPDSYVLRPYFLAQLAQIAVKPTDFEAFNTYPLAFLIALFVRREAEKLSGVIELTTSLSDIETATRAFYRELARSMADYETDAFDVNTLQLMASFAFEAILQGDDLDRIKYRVESIALLERVGETSRRFSHSEIQNYFFADAVVDLIGKHEIPKAIMRNHLGTDVLRTFGYTAETLPEEKMSSFLNFALAQARGRSSSDRTAKNLGCLILAASQFAGLVRNAELRELALDDVVIEGIAGPIKVESVLVNQLDARGANLEAITFDKCQIGSLIADDTTLLPLVFPHPGFIEASDKGKQQPIFDKKEIQKWIIQHQRRIELEDSVDQPVSDEPLVKLLEKVCRVMLRQYWIRAEEGDRAGRLLQDPEWNRLEPILDKHDLLRKEIRAAGDSRSVFIHVKRPKEILSKFADPVIVSLWNDVRRAVTDQV